MQGIDSTLLIAAGASSPRALFPIYETHRRPSAFSTLEKKESRRDDLWGFAVPATKPIRVRRCATCQSQFTKQRFWVPSTLGAGLKETSFKAVRRPCVCEAAANPPAKADIYGAVAGKKRGKLKTGVFRQRTPKRSAAIYYLCRGPAAYSTTALRPSQIGASFACGEFIYPLRNPLSQTALSRLSQQLLKQAMAPAQLIERAFHFEFQRLYLTPPHEITVEDESLWEFLLEYLDYDAYRTLNPHVVTKVGRLVSRDLTKTVVKWFGEMEETFDSVDLCPDIWFSPPGATIEMEFKPQRDGKTRIVSCRLSPPLRDDEQVWKESGDEIPAADELPPGSWPKHD